VNVGSLFSGIGGLDLGLERAGMRVIWQSEIDPYACRVLAKHWPDVPNLGDITTIDWSTVERPDVICGGYPCQPFSLAGVRRGEQDPRHLWPYFHRAIRHLRPRYALLENVPGHLSMGFDAVLGDLAEIGYDVEWCSVPAAAVGAPHLRWRIFAVAYPNSESEPGVTIDAKPRPRVMVPDAERDELRQQQPVPIFGRSGTAVTGDDGASWDVADAPNAHGWTHGAITNAARPQGQHESRRTISGGRTRVDWWAVEPDVGRVAHGVPSRLHGGGLDVEQGRDSQARPAGAPEDDRLFDLWRDGSTPPPPPGLHEAGDSGDRLLPMSRHFGRGGRDADDEGPEAVRDMRGDVHGVQPLTGEELLAAMSVGGWAPERFEAMGWWGIEPPIGRVAAGVANRVDRLRCLGNAVVPQVAQWLGERIIEASRVA
jgi:site-specific DNA-cytosine methylase